MPLLRMSRRGWIVVVAATVAVAALWYPTAYPRGMLMAYADRARGQFEIMSVGGPPLPPIEQEKRRLYLVELKERYGVEHNIVTGCVVTQSLRWYIDGYNSVSRRLLIQDHEVDIFAECRRLALEKRAE